MAEKCPMELFLEYVSDEEIMLQKMAHGESLRDIVREFQEGYKSYEGAKQAALRRLALETRRVLERIFRDEGELFSVPVLESLRERVQKTRTRTRRAKAWWCRRRKDSVLVTVGNRRGAVRKDDAWKLRSRQGSVFVSFPDGRAEWVSSSATS